MAWSGYGKEQWRKVQQEVFEAGGKEKIDKKHQNGMLTARERLELLFDDGKYTELKMLSQSRVELGDVKKKHYLGDGVVTGVGEIYGKIVYAVAQDSTISGGAGGEAHVDKICNALDMAIKTKRPIVFLCDSGGARIEEGIISLAAYSRLFRLNAKASGLILQVAAIMGNCAGGSSYSPAMCDFLFMVEKTSQLFITGPKVIKALTGDEVTMEQLGGTVVHSQYSGQAHRVCKNDQECLTEIRELIRFFEVERLNKQSHIRKPDYSRWGMEIENIVPEYKKTSYDVRDVICKLTDDGEFFEIQKEFAKNMVIGFSRFDGRTVGVIANQPQNLGGAIDCDAADKCARFVRTCDCFDIPLLVMVDVPGFYPGEKSEKDGILRHGCKMLYAFSEATVPSISLIMRKGYGGAYCAMNSKDLGADMVYAWPICEIAVMGSDGAVDVLFGRDITAASSPEEFRNKKIEEYEEKYLNPFFAASYGMIDEVILPENTREKIISTFKFLENKESSSIKKKHGNISL